MGRTPCCDRAAVKRGPWSPEEDDALRDYMRRHGNNGSWITLPQRAGLRRCGKSCRLRWLNYLRPDIRHGGFTDEEDALIYSLYSQIGSKWSLIASKLERRTDNDVKNHWNTKLKKRLAAAATFSSTRSPSFSPLPAPTPPPAPAHPSSSLLFPFAAPTVKAEAYSTYDDGGDFLAPAAALHDPFGAAEGSTSASLSAASSGSNWSSAVDNGAAADGGGAGGFFADFCTAAVSDLDAADQFLTGFYYPLDTTVSPV
ncbi:hypothetical protein QYE76_050174 [Lolium multiflorum]|uniref:Uncharacterized protein n=1 Tax=Lolium multiflorum TaxID=4521 RepID=A0AAD8SQC3_LOLMU|nr:hypothetical protein QYE76_050174 [Lolium multiflorum]